MKVKLTTILYGECYTEETSAILQNRSTKRLVTHLQPDENHYHQTSLKDLPKI